MRSMTGFGSHRAQTSHVAVDVSVRAVNGRFLEPRLHLPREFIPFEGEIRKILSEKMKRGTVDVFIQRREREGVSRSKIQVNRDLAKKYAQAYRTLAKDLRLRDELHLDVIARLPDVVKVDEAVDVDPAEQSLLLKAVKSAVDHCVREREREGKSLRKDLEKLLGALEKELRTVQSLREEANKQLQERFEGKLASRLKGGEIDPQRLSQEIVLQLERSDINEEIQRLGEHIKNYRAILSSREAEGKKLDFYTQELLREVNTIGSKSQVARITQSVVEAKTMIERLREQVQNVE